MSRKEFLDAILKLQIFFPLNTLKDTSMLNTNPVMLD